MGSLWYLSLSAIHCDNQNGRRGSTMIRKGHVSSYWMATAIAPARCRYMAHLPVDGSDLFSSYHGWLKFGLHESKSQSGWADWYRCVREALVHYY